MESVRDIEKRQRMANGPANEVRYSMFAAPFSIRCTVSYLFVPIFTIQGSLFNVRRAVRHSPRRSPFASSFAAPFAIRPPFPIYFPHFLLFNVRYAMFAAPLAIRSSPFANRRTIRRAMSRDAFHNLFQCSLFKLRQSGDLDLDL